MSDFKDPQELVDYVNGMIEEIDGDVDLLEETGIPVTEEHAASFARSAAVLEQNFDLIPYGIVKQIKPGWDALVARFLALKTKNNS